MAGPADAIRTRVASILGGTYPAAPASPYIPAGLFAAVDVTMPKQNERWPAGTARAAVSRRWELVWSRARWDGNAVEGSAGGPWVRRLGFDLRAQYEIALPAALYPTDSALTLGALSLASQRALDDMLEVQRVFMLDAAWGGVALAYVPSDDAVTIDPITPNTVTLHAHLRGDFLVEQAAMTAATLWTP
jgi:hypothetical protein